MSDGKKIRKTGFKFKATKDGKKLRKKRIKALKQCPVVDGITKCPPTGYGSIYD